VCVCVCMCVCVCVCVCLCVREYVCRAQLRYGLVDWLFPVGV